MSQTLVIVILILASLTGTVLIGYALMQSSRRQAALRNAVTDRGWRYDRQEGTGGRARVTTISDPEAGWRMEIKLNSATDGSGRTKRSTTWHAPDAGIAEGLAILGPAMSPAEARKAETMLGKLGGGMGGFLMSSMFGDLGPEAARLESVDVPGARCLMMATPEAREALTPIATHPIMDGTEDSLPRGALPVIRRSPKGLEISLRTALSRPEQVLALAELGATMQRELTPR
ncbi:hypothetical protein [Nioella sp. MMSF_3534]|uniref:hypothetical protein n=1 Tax=Nioella sp. MMSF_3534 TaxID=3046720 RepID=UPI00273E43F0|nr:hypothetical protein [Nioella sp. MMSF_3534]